MDPSVVVTTEMKEAALRTIDDIYTNKTGSLCVTEDYYVLPVILLSVSFMLKIYGEAKSASQLIQRLGIQKEDVVLEHLLRDLITPENNVIAVRAIALDNNNGDVLFSYGWKVVGQHRLQRLKGPRMGSKLDGYPWYRPAVSADGRIVLKGNRTQIQPDQQGWWTAPYYSCESRTWTMSYGVDILYSDNHEITLLTLSVLCIMASVVLAGYVYRHRNNKVIKVANLIFLEIILLGCITMYLEMVALFPVHNLYSCIATKWTYHLGFFITYIGLLMMTRRFSLLRLNTSTHMIKPLDKQLTQRMLLILLVTLIYLGAWTLLSPPTAEEIHDRNDLIFKQCAFNWWDYSLAMVEILFLAWGIKVSLALRNAESLFSEGCLISYTIYTLVVVNGAFLLLHHLIFQNAGPDAQYFLGFVSTQLSSTVTILFVFGPKVIRLIRRRGDQYGIRARAEGVTESFSLSAISHTTEVTAVGSHEN